MKMADERDDFIDIEALVRGAVAHLGRAWGPAFEGDAASAPLLAATAELAQAGLTPEQFERVIARAEVFVLMAFDQYLRATASGLQNQRPTDNELDKILRHAGVLAALALQAESGP